MFSLGSGDAVCRLVWGSDLGGLPKLCHRRALSNQRGRDRGDRFTDRSDVGALQRGQSWSGGTCTGDPSLISHENALSTAKQRSGWRLPSVKELSALVDRGCVSPAIDRTAFPNTPNRLLYWSSTPYVVGADASSWSVNFVSGNVGFSMRYDNLAVRLVKTTP